ncbi:hypothetical protein, partial [Candidatus Albibeggiatoa sp. nov. NOAA]|uniref:WD40 repeat domain-containing protein n=1 Tax=Candidatus Albibeggiatoa sp. nov. NOAA TaxID=3162724 RepID=UPI0032FC822C|nr:hypothetical protein [Thiotrichaceae bacterium]
MWDLKTQKPIGQLDGHSDWVKSLMWVEGKNLLASGDTGGIIRLWDLETQKPIGQLDGHSDWVTSLMWVEGKNLLASGSNDKTIRLWDLETKKQIDYPLTNYASWVRNSVFAQNMLVLTGDQYLYLWGIQSDKTLQFINRLDGHSSGVTSLMWIEGKNLLASGDSGGTIRLWNLEIKKQI